ncbi:MAG: hypothetical protein Q9179_007740, partial [Wetmoreana sp. 5 TL-2023]
MSMLDVLLMLEKDTIPPLDQALLGTFTATCQRIGAQIITALEGDQRGIFQDLYARVTADNLDRAVQTVSGSVSGPVFRLTTSNFSIGFGAVSLGWVAAICRRGIRRSIRRRSLSAPATRPGPTDVATTLPARNADDRKDISSHKHKRKLSADQSQASAPSPSKRTKTGLSPTRSGCINSEPDKADAT